MTGVLAGAANASPLVLVTLAGLTPQVVTETLYALLEEGEVPAEVHVLTTQPGRQKVRELLLDPRRGAFYTLCSEYGVDHRAVRFDLGTVHALSGPDGKPIEDLRTEAENAAVADQIVSFVRELAGRGVRIHASLAGGRKTMTFYLGYALSLFGRPDDRLSHVLVSEDFESHPEFFYPPRKPRDLKTAADKWVHTSAARVDLVDIPFVRLREYVPAAAMTGGFAEMVRTAQAGLAEQCRLPEVRLDLTGRRILMGGLECRLREQPFAVYLHLVLARLHAAREGGEPARSFADLTGEPYCEDLWQWAGTVLGLGNSPAFHAAAECVEKLAESGRGDRNFVAVVSKVNRALGEALPDRLSRMLQVRRAGRNPVLYGLDLDAEAVRFEGMRGSSPARRSG